MRGSPSRRSPGGVSTVTNEMANAIENLTITTLNPYTEGKSLEDFAREVLSVAKKLKSNDQVIIFRYRSVVNTLDETGRPDSWTGSWLYEVLRTHLPANKVSVQFKPNYRGAVYLHTDYTIKLVQKAEAQNLCNPADFKL